MKQYASPKARLRAFYQLPTPPSLTAAIELYCDDSGRIIDDDWPAETLVSCRLTTVRPNGIGRRVGRMEEQEASIHESLPFPLEAFDVAILHYTLDELLQLLPGSNPYETILDWLKRISRHLRPGGLIVGCTANATSPRNWFSPAAPLGIASCRKALLQSGYINPEVFNMIPGPDSPRAIISTEFKASRRAFARELDAAGNRIEIPGYLARKVIVELSLNRYLESTLFFWGYKPCCN